MEFSLLNLKESVKPIVERGIANAKSHEINVHHGVENLANGDCALECMLDGISTRKCFQEVYDGTPAFWRRKWFTECEDIAMNFYNAGMEEEDWRAAWDVLKNSGEYEYVLGDTEKDVIVLTLLLGLIRPYL